MYAWNAKRWLVDWSILSLFLTACPVVGVTVYVTSILFCYDPLFIVLQDAFSEWNLGLLCLYVRMFFTFVAFEIARTAAILFSIFILTFDGLIQRLVFIKTVVSRHIPHVEYVYRSSIKITIIFRTLAPTADAITSTMYSSAFWGMVLAGWIAVDGYELVPAYVYWMMFTLAPSLFLTFIGTLLIVGSVCDISTVLTRKLRHVCSVQRSKSRSLSDRSLQRISMKKCNSLAPLAVQYLPVSQPISRNFARNWFQNIVDRWFDAILFFWNANCEHTLWDRREIFAKRINTSKLVIRIMYTLFSPSIQVKMSPVYENNYNWLTNLWKTHFIDPKLHAEIIFSKFKRLLFLKLDWAWML